VACGDAPGEHQTLINPVGEAGEAGTFYDALAQLLAEFGARIGAAGLDGGAPLLPWVHLGGDEVTDYTCWLQSAAVQAWCARINISGSDPVAIRTAFTARVQQVAAAAGLRAAVWEESFTGGFGLDAGTVVTPWVNEATVRRAVEAGHDVVVYAGYYLDQWAPPARTDVDWSAAQVAYGYIESWRSFYAFDPVASANVSAALAGKVLGGVASAWGDQVDSSVGATGMLYPRALAIGEKLRPHAFATIGLDCTRELNWFISNVPAALPPVLTAPEAGNPPGGMYCVAGLLGELRKLFTVFLSNPCFSA